MMDDKVVKAFLDNQLKLYPEEVAFDMDEARDFLEDMMPSVASSKKAVLEYLEYVGVDTEGMSMTEILNMPEIFDVGDGRYLILEI